MNNIQYTTMTYQITIDLPAKLKELRENIDFRQYAESIVAAEMFAARANKNIDEIEANMSKEDVMETIDRKFKILAVNPCNGKVYTEADGYFVCAHDLTAPASIDAMIAEGKKIGAGESHIRSLEMLKDRVNLRQISGDKKIPDTDTDCEIRRCIGGEGV